MDRRELLRRKYRIQTRGVRSVLGQYGPVVNNGAYAWGASTATVADKRTGKVVGKPYWGKPDVRFDEGAEGKPVWESD